MSILSIVGQPGSGKSYCATELILKAIETGRPIVTNMPLKIEYEQLYKWEWSHLSEANVTQYPAGSLYVLDECWRGEGFSSSKKAGQLSERVMSFFKEHRHRVGDSGKTDDIILVTQSLGDITKTIRDLVETTIVCDKPSDIGLTSQSIRYYYRGGYTKLDLHTDNNSFIKTERIKISPEVYKHYSSHTQKTDDSLIAEEGTVIKSTLFQSFKFKGGAALFVFVLTYGIYSVNHIVTDTIPRLEKQPELTEPTKPSPAINTTPAPSPPVKTEPTQPSFSTDWRLVGVVRSDDINRSFAMLKNIIGITIRIPLHYCKLNKGQLECDYSNQIVTNFTGIVTAKKEKTFM